MFREILLLNSCPGLNLLVIEEREKIADAPNTTSIIKDSVALNFSFFGIIINNDTTNASNKIVLQIKVVEIPAAPTVCFISAIEYFKRSAPNGTSVCKKYSASAA